MNTINVYTPAELKESFPDAFEKAYRKYVSAQDDIPWTDEIIDSMQGLFKAAGIRLWDYSIGAYSQGNRVRFDLPYDYDSELDARQLDGQRAYNWIKANILDGAKFKRVTYSKKHGGRGWRYDIIKKDGTAWSCEFTGVCYDHDFIESLLDDIRGGCTLEDALHNLADTAGRILENEYEYQTSEECFLESDYLQYTQEGRLV